MNIKLELPEDIARHLCAEGLDLPRAALEGLALEAYRARRLTSEQMRRLLGFSTRFDVDGFLKQHQVWLEYTCEDLDLSDNLSFPRESSPSSAHFQWHAEQISVGMAARGSTRVSEMTPVLIKPFSSRQFAGFQQELLILLQ